MNRLLLLVVWLPLALTPAFGSEQTDRTRNVQAEGIELIVDNGGAGIATFRLCHECPSTTPPQMTVTPGTIYLVMGKPITLDQAKVRSRGDGTIQYNDSAKTVVSINWWR